MTANAVAKTIVFWIAVLWLGYVVWRGFGFQHPATSHGILGGVALLGSLILAFLFSKAILYVLYWAFVREPASAQ